VTLLRREHHERRRVPFVAISPAEPDVGRYHKLVATVAEQAHVVLGAQSSGALTREEALAVLRRQAGDLLTAIALLDARDRT
jgi:hypothetical protein